MASKLAQAVGAVDWSANANWFVTNVDLASRVESSNLRIALWARQLEQADVGNSALCFVREMQGSGHQLACTLSLALYKPAAAAMRTLVECALYYLYFRTHVVELSTLTRDSKYFVSKKYIIEYFGTHIPEFNRKQSALALVSRAGEWYSRISAIVHGQIPGKWSNGSGIAGLSHVEATASDVVDSFEVGVKIAEDLFFCVIADELWGAFSSPGKKAIIKGMSGDKKKLLGLDSA